MEELSEIAQDESMEVRLEKNGICYIIFTPEGKDRGIPIARVNEDKREAEKLMDGNVHVSVYEFMEKSLLEMGYKISGTVDYTVQKEI